MSAFDRILSLWNKPRHRVIVLASLALVTTLIVLYRRHQQPISTWQELRSDVWFIVLLPIIEYDDPTNVSRSKVKSRTEVTILSDDLRKTDSLEYPYVGELFTQEVEKSSDAVLGDRTVTKDVVYRLRWAAIGDFGIHEREWNLFQWSATILDDTRDRSRVGKTETHLNGDFHCERGALHDYLSWHDFLSAEQHRKIARKARSEIVREYGKGNTR